MRHSEAISWLRHELESKLEKVIHICRGIERTSTNQYAVRQYQHSTCKPVKKINHKSALTKRLEAWSALSKIALFFCTPLTHYR